MTKPLQLLAAFAKRIGKGDFTQNDRSFHDRELATLADNLNNTAAQLDNIDREQQIFFQNASHELRTPLMTIRSYAEGILYDVMPSKEASKTIITETSRMTEMVEDLLTASRLQHLEQQQEFQNFDLRELIEDVANEQEAIAQQRGLKFVYQLDKSPVLMTINYKALRRAVSNLISNSLRYAKSEIVLSVSADKKVILLSVANDGPAIATEDLPHIFERFYKGHGGVHGIGLSIVKAVVEQHGGKINVVSSEDETRFVMRFPLQ
jgi:signal transduction histidine kinase